MFYIGHIESNILLFHTQKTLKIKKYTKLVL